MPEVFWLLSLIQTVATIVATAWLVSRFERLRQAPVEVPQALSTALERCIEKVGGLAQQGPRQLLWGLTASSLLLLKGGTTRNATVLKSGYATLGTRVSLELELEGPTLGPVTFHAWGGAVIERLSLGDDLQVDSPTPEWSMKGLSEASTVRITLRVWA